MVIAQWQMWTGSLRKCSVVMQMISNLILIDRQAGSESRTSEVSSIASVVYLNRVVCGYSTDANHRSAIWDHCGRKQCLVIWDSADVTQLFIFCDSTDAIHAWELRDVCNSSCRNTNTECSSLIPHQRARDVERHWVGYACVSILINVSVRMTSGCCCIIRCLFRPTGTYLHMIVKWASRIVANSRDRADPRSNDYRIAMYQTLVVVVHRVYKCESSQWVLHHGGCCVTLRK